MVHGSKKTSSTPRPPSFLADVFILKYSRFKKLFLKSVSSVLILCFSLLEMSSAAPTTQELLDLLNPNQKQGLSASNLSQKEMAAQSQVDNKSALAALQSLSNPYAALIQAGWQILRKDDQGRIAHARSPEGNEVFWSYPRTPEGSQRTVVEDSENLRTYDENGVLLNLKEKNTGRVIHYQDGVISTIANADGSQILFSVTWESDRSEDH